LDRVLHPESGIAGADGMVLVGERSAEERHDAVAHHLIDRALKPVNGLHHVFKNRIEDLPGVLWIAVGEQLHRTLEIGKENCHLLALAFESALRDENLLDKVLRSVGLRGSEASLSSGGRADRLPALQTELCTGREVSGALGAFLC